MKYFFKIIIILFILFNYSCQRKKETSLFYHEPHWKYYSIKIQDTLITGTVFDIYSKSKDSVVGTIIDDKITWTDIDLSNNQKSAEMTGWRNEKNEIILPYDTVYFPKDTIVIKPISEKLFRRKIDSSFHPKLTNRKKVFTSSDYIFEINVKNWNYQEHKGETSISIKRKDNNTVQIIKSKDFVFSDNITFEFEDKNFDGMKDLNFYIGNIGNKSSPAYDCYLFNQNNRKFEYSEELSNIFSQVGTSINKKEKTITSYSTGSCCSHYADKYKISANNIIKIKRMEILDESNGGLKVTIEELQNKKWIKKVKIYSPNEIKSEDLYKNF